jgi:uncharacterized protein DUF3631
MPLYADNLDKRHHPSPGRGIELLKDIRAAFGDDDEIRSADLIAKLTADPERPWAEWKHGRPLEVWDVGRAGLERRVTRDHSRNYGH